MATALVFCRRSLERAIVSLAVVAAGTLMASAAHASPQSSGRAIYAQSCVECHAEDGSGVREQFTPAFAGNMTLSEMATYIEEYMPEEEPETIVGDEAAEVARYIFDEFYTPLQQMRYGEAKVEMARLTGPQFRNAVADVVGSFREQHELGEERGLRAQYYDARRPEGDVHLERIDETIDLDYEAGDEVDEGLDPIGFATRWQGSIIVPETGRYQFVVNTDHAVRLWVNDMDDHLIDRWVVSGDDTEFRASIFLVGGRSYPIKVEFSSRQQGVQFREDVDAESVPGFINLQWSTPEQPLHTIPSRNFSPDDSAELLVVDRSFPPEDRSTGYVRAGSIPPEWQRAVSDGAIEAAHYVADHLPELAGVRVRVEGRSLPSPSGAIRSERPDGIEAEDLLEIEKRLREFSEKFVERAFRRPLDDQTRQLYIDRHFETTDELDTAIERVVLMTLMSPRFLYLDFGADEPDPYEVATRLSFTLWDSVPDAELYEAAEQGLLSDRAEIRRQAERMVEDLRTRYKMRQFFHHWLHLDHNPEPVKDAELFPDFDDQVIADLRRSFYLFLEDVVWGDEPDYRRLVNSNRMYVNGRLAGYYGIDLPEDAPFQLVEADVPQRRGVVSHPFVMAVFSYDDETSPIHRGMLMARDMIGRTLNPPPEAFTPDPPEDHPGLTHRERVVKQTAPASCMSCHSLMNPLGFTLEQFDADGRFRTEEAQGPVDPTGHYEPREGETAYFDDTADLAAFIAESEESQLAFTMRLFHHMAKQPMRGYGEQRPEQTLEKFAAEDYHIRQLLVELADTVASNNLPSPLEAAEAEESPADPPDPDDRQDAAARARADEG